MKKKSRRALVAGGILVAAAVVYLATRGGGIPVSTAIAARDSLSVAIAVEGRTRARDVFSVTAPVTGRLSRIDLDEGDTVEAGDVVARLTPTLEDPRTVAALRAEVEAARASYIQAQSQVEQARARAEQARRELDRRRPLAEMGAISAEALDQAETNARVAEDALGAAQATLEAADARLQAARARLLGAEGDEGDTPAIEVRAPVGGRVLSLPDPSSRVVTAGTPLLELADVDGLEVVFDVLSEDAVRIEPGQEVHVTEWGGGGVLRGQVRTVTLAGYTEVSALGVEEQRVDVVADLDSIPPNLGTGYRVSGAIVVWHGDSVLTVPTSAVFRTDDGWSVYTVVAERAELTSVTLGRRNEDRAQIVSGLEEGTRVITFPPSEIEDGTRVELEEGGG